MSAVGLNFNATCDLCGGSGDVGGAPCSTCARRVREVLLRGLRPTVAGTLRALDDQATYAIECARPAYVRTDAVKRALAFRWLGAPPGFWRRLVWVVRLAFGGAS